MDHESAIKYHYNNSTKYLLQKENLPNLSVLVYTYIKICCIYIVFTVFNRGNLLHWLYHGLNLYENRRNLAALLVFCYYFKILLMAALIYCTSYKHEEYQ